MNAVLCTLGNLILSIIAIFFLRNWIYISAFDGYSQSRIKKIKRSCTVKDNLFYLHTLSHQNTSVVKAKIIFCYMYYALVLVSSIAILFSAAGITVRLAAGGLFLLLRTIDIVLFVVWVIEGKKIIG